MACDPSTLMADAKCVAAAFTYHQSLAAWTYLACNSSPIPPVDDERVTDDGGTRITDDGGTRVVDV